MIECTCLTGKSIRCRLSDRKSLHIGHAPWWSKKVSQFWCIKILILWLWGLGEKNIWKNYSTLDCDVIWRFILFTQASEPNVDIENGLLCTEWTLFIETTCGVWAKCLFSVWREDRMCKQYGEARILKTTAPSWLQHICHWYSKLIIILILILYFLVS